jgi:hypothetical protein
VIVRSSTLFLILVGKSRCDFPVAERSVRRRNDGAVTRASRRIAPLLNAARMAQRAIPTLNSVEMRTVCFELPVNSGMAGRCLIP